MSNSFNPTMYISIGTAFFNNTVILIFRNKKYQINLF